MACRLVTFKNYNLIDYYQSISLAKKKSDTFEFVLINIFLLYIHIDFGMVKTLIHLDINQQNLAYRFLSTAFEITLCFKMKFALKLNFIFTNYN